MSITHIGIITLPGDERAPPYEKLTIGFNERSDLEKIALTHFNIDYAPRLNYPTPKTEITYEINEQGLKWHPGNDYYPYEDDAIIGVEPQVTFNKHGQPGENTAHAFKLEDLQMIESALKSYGIKNVPSANQLMKCLDEAKQNGREFGSAGHCQDWRKGILGLHKVSGKLPTCS